MWRVALILLVLSGCQMQPAQEKNLSELIATFQALEPPDEEEWPSFDSIKLERDLEAYTHLESELTKIDLSQLDGQDQINVDMLNLVIQDKLSQLRFESHLVPLNAEGGFLAGIVYAIRDMHIDKQEDIENYLERLKTLPDYIAQRNLHLRKGHRKGKMVPRLIVENCMAQVRQQLEATREQSIFNKPELDLTHQKTVTRIVESEIKPAYQSLLDYLQNEYLPHAPEQIGISNMNSGKQFYEERIRYFTTFDITPEEVFQTGQQEVKRIRREMERIIEDLGFKGSFADFLQFLRTDPQFYPRSGDELLKEAAWITTRIQGELPKYFTHLPRMPLTVKPVPDALAPNYTGGRYSGGSFDVHKAGQYWVNTYNLPSRPYYVLPALTLHEGVPGHHTQIMLANELEGMPEFRTQTYLSAFGEGWALYTEYLGKEMGIYTTPYEDFGRLVYEMWRACRLVVDPGMHYKGWTRQQAVDFMAENTALSMHEINTEINRYIGWPAQAVSYKMGELKIRELRQRAEQELEDLFDIRVFHDKVLENGSIPLNSLERIVVDYIDNTKQYPLAN